MPHGLGDFGKDFLVSQSTLKKILGRTHATVIVEIEALLNDRQLTYVMPDLRDPEPITSAHLLYGKRITTFPHCTTDLDELDDPDFGDVSDL